MKIFRRDDCVNNKLFLFVHSQPEDKQHHKGLAGLTPDLI